MINLNKIMESILQNLERVVRLVLVTWYENRRISPTIDFSVFQQ